MEVWALDVECLEDDTEEMWPYYYLGECTLDSAQTRPYEVHVHEQQTVQRGLAKMLEDIDSGDWASKEVAVERIEYKSGTIRNNKGGSKKVILLTDIQTASYLPGFMKDVRAYNVELVTRELFRPLRELRENGEIVTDEKGMRRLQLKKTRKKESKDGFWETDLEDLPDKMREAYAEKIAKR